MRRGANPLKQGLKLTVRGYRRSGMSGRRTKSIKTRIETPLRLLRLWLLQLQSENEIH